MRSRQENYRLLVKFCQSDWLKAQGVEIKRTLTGPVALLHNGERIGTWWYEIGVGYCFSRDVQSTPMQIVNTADAALGATLAMITRHSAKRSA